jgi:hypothetical protein
MCTIFCRKVKINFNNSITPCKNICKSAENCMKSFESKKNLFFSWSGIVNESREIWEGDSPTSSVVNPF